jgi:hypothetical protein
MGSGISRICSRGLTSIGRITSLNCDAKVEKKRNTNSQKKSLSGQRGRSHNRPPPLSTSLKAYNTATRTRAGLVSVFQVGVGYRLFFRLFFQVGRFSVFIKNLGFGFGFLRSTIYLIF